MQAAYAARSKHGAPEKILQWGGAGTGGEPVIYNLLAQRDIEATLPPSVFAIQVWDELNGTIAPSLLHKGYSHAV